MWLCVLWPSRLPELKLTAISAPRYGDAKRLIIKATTEVPDSG